MDEGFSLMHIARHLVRMNSRGVDDGIRTLRKPASQCSGYHRRFKGQLQSTSRTAHGQASKAGEWELRSWDAGTRMGSGTCRQEGKRQEEGGEPTVALLDRCDQAGIEAQTRGVSTQGGARANCAESSRSRNDSRAA